MKFRHRDCYFVLLFFVLPIFGFGQAIDNTSAYRDVPAGQYFRFGYDNDFFDATDNYYTQGFTFEYVATGLRKWPVSRLLLHPKGSTIRYGIALEHEGYTPSTIRHHELLIGDRPFTACLFLKSFAIAEDSIKHRRISSSLSTGVMGPWAIGEQMQRTIHKWLNNLPPYGWEHQLHNDVIINYELTHEKEIIGYKQLFMLSSWADARAGTLSDKAALGLTAMIGNEVNPFKTKRQHKAGIMLYEHPFINAVAYDATLEGGVFNKTSPYVLPAGSINRLTFQNMMGFVLRYRQLNVEYYQAYLSEEFNGGRIHKWGGIRLVMGF